MDDLAFTSRDNYVNDDNHPEHSIRCLVYYEHVAEHPDEVRGRLSILLLWLTTASSFFWTLGDRLSECQMEQNQTYAKHKMQKMLTMWTNMKT